jgi:hypothetical protein
VPALHLAVLEQAAEAVVSFFPIDRDLLTSSMWATGSPEAIKLWVYMLLSANPRTGVVDDAAPALALRCGIPLDKTLVALDWLASPDTHSRSKNDDGRRIEPLEDGGYRLVNYMKRSLKDHSTPRVQRFRQRKRAAETVERVSETVGTTEKETDKDNRPTVAPPSTPSRVDAFNAVVDEFCALAGKHRDEVLYEFTEANGRRFIRPECVSVKWLQASEDKIRVALVGLRREKASAAQPRGEDPLARINRIERERAARLGGKAS